MYVLFMVFDHFVWKPQREEQLARKNQVSQTQTEPVQPAQPDTVKTTTPLISSTVLDSIYRQSSVQSDSIVLENDLVKITFSNRGAEIKQVELKKFQRRDGSNATLIPNKETESSLAGTRIFHSTDETHLQNLLFDHKLEAGNRLVFELYPITAPSNSGEVPQSEAIITKTYTLGQDYALDFRFIANAVSELRPIYGIELDFGSGIADTEQNLKNKATDYRFLTTFGTKLYKQEMRKLTKQAVDYKPASFEFAAIKSKYFCLAAQEIAPKSTQNIHAYMNKEVQSPAFYIDSRQRDPKQRWEQQFRLYLGPVDHSVLEQYGLEKIAERGKWLGWLANIFAWVLRFLHGLIPNYGIVIIIFSILLKLILHPVSHKQLDASMKMQKIQPQLRALQQQYKNDLVKLRAEQSRLYKENGVSPLSGCLPLLLQMPIFFSLYSVLRSSLDMRNAHFVGWIKDLSEPDPYLVLPILMGGFMIIQSLMMRPPTEDIDQMDDKQKAQVQSQKMMTWLMPIVFFFVFRNMPAGLVLYWTVFNVLSILQQYYLQKRMKNRTI